MKTESLVASLRAHFDGQPWHGSSLRDIVASVDPSRAYVRPSPEVRSIAELLAHTIAWIEIIDERLNNSSEVKVTPERDFPSVQGVSWDSLCARLDRAHEKLLKTVAGRDDDAWKLTVPGKSRTFAVDILGLMHHNTYHSAQIAILNRIEATD